MKCHIHIEPDGTEHIIPGDCTLWNEFHLQGDLTNRQFIKQHCTCKPSTFYEYEEDLFSKKQAELIKEIEDLQIYIQSLEKQIEYLTKTNNT